MGTPLLSQARTKTVTNANKVQGKGNGYRYLAKRRRGGPRMTDGKRRKKYEKARPRVNMM